MRVDAALVVLTILSAASAESTGLEVRQQTCRPIKCAQAIIDGVKNGIGALKNCAQVAAEFGTGRPNVINLFSCVTDAAKTAFNNIGECQRCRREDWGECKTGNSEFAHQRSCGNSMGFIGLTGPSKCAQYAGVDTTPAGNDRVWQNYVMHCDNFALDILNRCWYRCSTCPQCTAKCPLPVDPSFNKAPQPNPRIYSQKKRDYVVPTLINSVSVRSDEKAIGLKDLESRQPPPRDDAAEGEDGTSLYRGNDYADQCWLYDVYMVTATVANPSINDYRLVHLPGDNVASFTDTGGVKHKYWVCDHILELNLVDTFLSTTNRRDTILQLHNMTAGGECPRERVKTILNSAVNLVGVDARINLLKNKVLQEGVNPDWATWQDYVVLGAWSYITQADIDSRYLKTASGLGNIFDALKQTGDTRNTHDDFYSWAESRLRRAADTLEAEIRRRGLDHRDGLSRVQDLPQDISMEDVSNSRPRNFPQDLSFEDELRISPSEVAALKADANRDITMNG